MQLSSSSESLLDSEESDAEENCTARGRRQTRDHRKHRRGRRRRIDRRRHKRRKHRKDWRKQVQEEKVGWVGGWVGGAGALERSRREGKFEEEQKKERAFVLAKDLVLHGGSLLGGVATMYYLQRRGSSTE